MKTRNYISTIAQYSFILLWGTAAALKLGNVPKWRNELDKQVFPLWATDILWWLLPALMIVLILPLLYRPAVNMGIKLSTGVISLFTLYLLLGVTGVFGSTPCACGGIWPGNDHWLHIALNSIFILLGTTYLVLAHSSRLRDDVSRRTGREEGTVLS